MIEILKQALEIAERKQMNRNAVYLCNLAPYLKYDDYHTYLHWLKKNRPIRRGMIGYNKYVSKKHMRCYWYRVQTDDSVFHDNAPELTCLEYSGIRIDFLKKHIIKLEREVQNETN